MECKCKGIPLPEMYINDKLSAARMAAYAANQGPVLVPIMSDDGPYIFYNANDFIAMIRFFTDPALFNEAITSVRIYFACYGDEGTPFVPEGYGNKFTFIFAPAFPDSFDPAVQDDYGKFYNIAPGGPFNPSGSEIDPDTASSWVNRWQQDWLKQLPVQESSANYDVKTDSYSDTRSLIYMAANLSGFLTEIQCQQAYGIKLYLASYTAADPNYPNRLTTQFVLTDRDGNDIIIDTSCRPTEGLKDFDTGSPCPPTPGCEGSTLPKK